MGHESVDVATLAAVVATVVSVSCTWPQLVRIRRTGDIAGVSVTAAALTVSSEVGWTVYLGGEGLWSAVPEGALTIAANALLVVAVARSGGSAPCRAGCRRRLGRRAPRDGSLGGPEAIATLLGLAYVVQLTPAVATAWRTWNPSGIATGTWTLRLIEAVLWGAYGYVRGDPPLVVFGILGVAESAAILARKVVTRHRPATPRRAGILVAPSHLLDDAVVG